MPSRFVSMFGAAALLMTGFAAEAASITNRDTKDVKITLSEGETTSEHTLRPMAVLDKVCLEGCILRLEDGEEDAYELEGGDVVAIEGGFLYYDGPDAPGTSGSSVLPPRGGRMAPPSGPPPGSKP